MKRKEREKKIKKLEDEERVRKIKQIIREVFG
jgi:hypothetical protein